MHEKRDARKFPSAEVAARAPRHYPRWEFPLMRTLLKRLTLGTTAALALVVLSPATSAFAITSPACGNRTDFLKLDVSVGGGLGYSKCFASAGVTAVNIGGVYRFSSGNNKVMVNWEDGGRYYTETLDRNWGRSLPDVRVCEVRIW
ncbi:beta/gamma crystallin domain-containing protein [Amycolatopsis sp. H20-H5]|uniref:beta/gamma crystallin domain-containing protein n=1 Tax=Amycolatopsis sp. H20-H5 TaxID=3046309 RepID=UPI002DB7AC9B|nr:beta/gamma crystallin domain-containing protein [Amycolatopsis sp. H20-H5]MEC3974238.1 beta/gamma crystallin domain-containing protein [Amycolatopsis sp. H20-H5]